MLSKRWWKILHIQVAFKLGFAVPLISFWQSEMTEDETRCTQSMGKKGTGRSGNRRLFCIFPITLSIQRLRFAYAIQGNRSSLFQSSWVKSSAGIALLSPAAALTFHKKATSMYLALLFIDCGTICQRSPVFLTHFSLCLLIRRTDPRFSSQPNPTRKKLR